MTRKRNRAYNALRLIVEELGGSMTHVQNGYRYGAWIVEIGGNRRVYEGVGNRTLPELDKYYKLKPGVRTPRDWDDYTHEFKEGAAELWRAEVTKIGRRIRL